MQKQPPITTQDLKKSNDLFGRIANEVNKYVIGRQHLVDRIIIGLLAQGHILLEGNPGNAKTLLAKTIAAAIGLDFKRIQFTPDLLPTDITGTHIYNKKDGDFEFYHGPIFTNFLLADEINRASPKTQSALLEVMEERQITMDGTTHSLSPPFIVLATQNPIDNQGVFPLPEAQIDRFLMKLQVDYPNYNTEIEILNRETLESRHPKAVVDVKTILWLQKLTAQVHIEETVKQYLVSLVQSLRNQSDVYAGPSPRSSFGLMRASQAKALTEGRAFVIPDDVFELAVDVLQHRIMLSSEAELNGKTTHEIIHSIKEQTSTLFDEFR